MVEFKFQEFVWMNQRRLPLARNLQWIESIHDFGHEPTMAGLEC